ncbi:MAG: tyrosine decarboxylase / aspartate 1-decarboxylase [Thermoplasmata archaeon]|nr:tyrosine decarboxylase / aspartate 1-decarboxylase [Thermoplasmata archaeon]
MRSALARARREDASFAKGQILGSMCTAPHDEAAHAHAVFLEVNLGDPAHFPGAARLEVEALADLLDLFHAPRGAAGRFTSGGTEANILALYLAREKTGRREVVLPDSAHFSFEKAARLLGMKLRYVPTDMAGRADVKAMQAAVGEGTALVVGIAGTTELGLVDPIEDLARMCHIHGVLLHVDASYGGYFLPFMGEAGRKPIPFDFALPGVWSLAVDPHKSAMATIPAGVLLLRDGRDWSHTAVRTPYVSTESQSTLLGTRPGGPIAATWAVHRHLGRKGLASVAETCLDNAAWLGARLPELGVELVASPELAVVALRADNPGVLAAKLAAKGFRCNVMPRFSALRVVVNPHITRDRLESFLKALEAVL